MSLPARFFKIDKEDFLFISLMKSYNYNFVDFSLEVTQSLISSNLNSPLLADITI